MSLANLVDSSDEGEDEELQDDNESDNEAIENMEDDMPKMETMLNSLDQPSYQNYMGFVDEDNEDFE